MFVFKDKCVVCIAICVFLSQIMFAQVVDYNNETILEIHKEYIQKGRISPFLYGPLLPGQVNKASDEIESQNYIKKTSRNGGKLGFYVNPSAQFFSDEVLIEENASNSNKANNAIDFTKNSLSIPQYVGFEVDFFSEFGLGGGFTMDIGKAFGNDHFQMFNISVQSVDKNFLRESSIYFDNEYISILAGRIGTQMSFPYADALFFNNNIPYTDTISMHIPFGNYFNLQWQITNIPSVKSSYQKDLVLGNELTDADPDYYYGFEHDNFPSVILNTYQRFGFQNDFLKAGLSLNVFLVRRNNRFEFIDFFPFAEWHAADVLPNNMSLGFDFGIVPIKNMLIDIQLGLDEINGTSIGLGDGATPTIWKIIGTIQNTLVRNCVSILFSTNIGYSHYLWGNFTGSSTGDPGEAGLSRALYRYHMNRPMYMPFTSEFGPGSFWVTQESVINFTNNKWLESLSLVPKMTFLLFEPSTNLIETEYNERSSSPEQSIYFGFEVPVCYKWRTLEAKITPSVHVVGLNRQTQTWFECRLSFKAFFSASLFEENEELKSEFEY